MGRTTQHTQNIYLAHDRAALLDELSAKLGRPKSALMREAIDALLVKYRMLRTPKKGRP